MGLIPKNGPYPEYIISNKQLKLRPNTTLTDPRFLFYYFASPQMVAHIRSRAIGAAVPGINLGILKSLPVALPPLRIQSRTADILSAYDDLIENNTRRIKILEEMARSLYREWFASFRFPGHEKVKLVVSSTGRIPEGWTIRALGDLADVNGRMIRGGLEPAIVDYVDISSVSPGSVEKTQRYAFEDAPGRARRLVQHGDTIWSMVRPNHRAHALLLDPSPSMVLSTGFAVLTPLRVPPSFLYLATTTDEFVNYLINHARGAAYPAVTGMDFERAPLLVPPDALTKSFDRVVMPMLEQVGVLRRRNNVLRRARDLLRPRLISGEIDVSGIEVPGG